MTNILGVGGNRLVWPDLPGHVRAGIEELLGAPVIQATSEPGGFSPGLAARVALADGRRMFVKAVSAARNEFSVEMFATEARNLAGLRTVEWRVPVAVPLLVGDYADGGDWIAGTSWSLVGPRCYSMSVRGEGEFRKSRIVTTDTA
ncbi:MAG TPA: hypothetical protein VF892_24255 [Pseudonocardiaceae bacterium]